jgi:hypothetical protein
LRDGEKILSQVKVSRKLKRLDGRREEEKSCKTLQGTPFVVILGYFWNIFCYRFLKQLFSPVFDLILERQFQHKQANGRKEE